MAKNKIVKKKKSSKKIKKEIFGLYHEDVKIMLQLYDRDIVNKGYLEKSFFIHFKTGEIDKQRWSNISQPFHIFFEFYDRKLISKKIMLESYLKFKQQQIC